MKFNKLEIIEISKISASLNVPMSLKLDGDNSIDYDFVNNNSIHSILKKTENGYRFYGVDSNGENFHYQNIENVDKLKYHLRNFVKSIKRDNPYELEKKENIENLNQNFYKIFQEATIINGLGFNESSGMIYRKSLEIIVKDYLKICLPKFFEFIDEKTIGKIIFHFYEKDNGELKVRKSAKFEDIQNNLEKIRPLTKIINITFDIGNDFSHYERRLLEFSTKDMKENILKIVEFIDHSLEKITINEKQERLNEEFDSNKLIQKKH